MFKNVVLYCDDGLSKEGGNTLHYRRNSFVSVHNMLLRCLTFQVGFIAV